MWNMNKPAEFVCELDVSKFSFRNFQVIENKPRVDIFYDDRKSVSFNLCVDAHSPVEAPYGLDSAQQNSDGSRRTLLVYVTDPNVIHFLTELDNVVVACALANSKEWFKKAMTEDEVRLRYKPLLYKRKDDDVFPAMKFKIKCVKYPTRLHMQLPTGDVVRNGATTDHIGRGASVVPVLTVFNMWFMNKEFGLSVQAEDVIITPNSSAPALPMFNFKRPVTIFDTDPTTTLTDDAAANLQWNDAKVQKTTTVPSTSEPTVQLVDEA